MNVESQSPAESFSFPVEAGHVLLFTRAIGGADPVGADAELAPPTFVAARAHFEPGYRFRPKRGEPWLGSGATPSGTASAAAGGEAPARFLHAEQHFEFHRPVRVGDVLTVTSRPGDSWTKESARNGTMRFSETIMDYRDADGELVVTARGVGVTLPPATEGR